ncbi:hypothetical protein NDN11_11835 [Acinetobacter sp. C26M]|uniref:hypothetical protein n=1 Tax=unclassified Acinetobacter TaxID=196816 RepID=UPI0020368AAA|nr:MULTISPECIES: hypothetical protein [unclassified Acinetobacter]USA45412.1 hypothetical protein NDN11_11835 [Acinetobacter sp. C26M]USA48914.1 hypothetical protein NDN12_11835 [Acinetobacter sp. C26G]
MNYIIKLDNVSQLTAVQSPTDGQTVYIESLGKFYTYNQGLKTSSNGVTVIDKWEMQIQEAYYASWFCEKDSIDNKSKPQTLNIELGYQYATSKNRPFIIDGAYYVESTTRKTKTSYPSLNPKTNDSLHYAIRVLSNSCLIFKKGVGKLKLVPNNQDWSRILCIFDVENYLIFEPELIGDKSEHLSNTGEQHMMLAIHPSRNGYIRNLICRDSWGDGLYIGYAHWANSYHIDVAVPTNIVIDNAQVYNSSRNGVSLCGANGLKINNLLVDKVDRIAPIAGIDIEPEEDASYNGGKLMHLKDVKIHNATIKNSSNYGVISFIYGSREVDVSFTGTTTFLAEAPGYCSFPIWFLSYQGEEAEKDYKSSGGVSFEKVMMSGIGGAWGIVAPISFYSALAKVHLSIDSLCIKDSMNPLVFGFKNTTTVNAAFSGGLNIKSIELHQSYDSVQLGDSVDLSKKVLKYIDLPIPKDCLVEYKNRGFVFENDVNIGGYSNLEYRGWYNTDELINNIIFKPKVNPDDGGSIQSRIYDLGGKTNGRIMSFSLDANLNSNQIGDGLYVQCGKLHKSNSNMASITCEYKSNGLRRIFSSYGTFITF